MKELPILLNIETCPLLSPAELPIAFCDISSHLYGTSQAGGGSVRSWRVWSLLSTVKTKKRKAVATSVTDRSPFPLPFCSLILNACLDSSSSTVDGGHSKSLLYQTIITFLYKTNSLILKRYCQFATRPWAHRQYFLQVITYASGSLTIIPSGKDFGLDTYFIP